MMTVPRLFKLSINLSNEQFCLETIAWGLRPIALYTTPVTKFVKMHGLGNDFVIIDAMKHKFAGDQETIAQMGDRRTGVGFDQMLIIEPPEHTGSCLSYRIFNGDGSVAEQCGNGARCVARYFADHHDHHGPMTMESPGGTLIARQLDQGLIELDMGQPNFDPKTIPLDMAREQESYEIILDDQQITFGAMSIGNPHAVIQVEDIATAPVAALGPALGTHGIFPNGVNVGFMQIIHRGELNLRVYERGVGETRACGTGACAAVAVARRRNLVDNETIVNLPGGPLTISWPGPEDHLLMAGPAKYVFEGIYE